MPDLFYFDYRYRNTDREDAASSSGSADDNTWIASDLADSMAYSGLTTSSHTDTLVWKPLATSAADKYLDSSGKWVEQLHGALKDSRPKYPYPDRKATPVHPDVNKMTKSRAKTLFGDAISDMLALGVSPVALMKLVTCVNHWTIAVRTRQIETRLETSKYFRFHKTMARYNVIDSIAFLPDKSDIPIVVDLFNDKSSGVITQSSVVVEMVSYKRKFPTLSSAHGLLGLLNELGVAGSAMMVSIFPKDMEKNAEDMVMSRINVFRNIPNHISWIEDSPKFEGMEL